MEHRPCSYVSEAVARIAPIAPIVPITPIAPVTCAGAVGTILYPSTQPYQVMVGKSVSPKSEMVTPVASTSSGCAGAGSALRSNREPYVEIVEQPKPGRRFRYDSEIASAGAIRGVEYKNNKSFPKIKIGNYTGPAKITVSLVCKEKPYRVHPNGIVGKKKLLEEDFTYIYVKRVLVTRDNCVIQFDDLGIRIVKPNQIKEALRLRKAQGIDPFKQGYRFSPESDDLQAVRLCFQVSLVTLQLAPVVSAVIYHSKKLGCLNIRRMSGCRGYKSGGPDIIFLSKELNPNDLEVVFYEEENGYPVWQECGRIFEVYERSAIVCAVPVYNRPGIPCDAEVTVSVALRRRSDGERGDPRPFTYSVDYAEVLMKKRKVIRDVIQQIPENWIPPDSLLPDNGSQYDQDWQNLPLPFDFNPAMPEPSYANPAMPEPISVHPTTPGLFDSNSVIPESNSTNSAMLEPISVTLAVSGPNHITEPVEPELSSINAFLPGPSQFQPLSPDIDTMSFSEDEAVLSPDWYLDKDGGIPSVDTVLADACANLLDS